MNSNNNPPVSILVVVWNECDVLDGCFGSIKNQTFQDYKVVCVNNGSDDKSFEKIIKWQGLIGKEKFQIISNKKNIGLTKALNVALKKANGKYIARLDPDDLWEKDKLARQVDFMEKNPEYGIIGCNHINVYKNNNNKKYINLPETHKLISEKLFRRNPFAHSCILAKTDLIKSVDGYDEKIKYGQDYELWLRCFPKTKFYNLQDFLCLRSVDSGISVKKQNAQMWQSIKTRLKYIRKYNYNWKNYLYLLEPLLVVLTPNFIKNLKRKYL